MAQETIYPIKNYRFEFILKSGKSIFGFAELDENEVHSIISDFYDFTKQEKYGGYIRVGKTVCHVGEIAAIIWEETGEKP